jgi:hypothetical protein
MIVPIEVPLRELLSAFGCEELHHDFLEYLTTGEVSACLCDQLDNNPACAKAFDAIFEAKLQALEEATHSVFKGMEPPS